MVKEVTKLVKLLPKKGGVHAVQSPWMLVSGMRLHLPATKCGQYIQGHVGGPNDTDVKRTFDSLYIGRNDGTTTLTMKTKEEEERQRQ